MKDWNKLQKCLHYYVDLHIKASCIFHRRTRDIYLDSKIKLFITAPEFLQIKALEECQNIIMKKLGIHYSLSFHYIRFSSALHWLVIKMAIKQLCKRNEKDPVLHLLLLKTVFSVYILSVKLQSLQMPRLLSLMWKIGLSFWPFSCPKHYRFKC